jgi:hypothetical protein
MKIEDIIAAASEELQVSYGENALWFKVLIHQAVRTFKSANALMMFSEKVETEDSRIKLPENFVKMDCLTDLNGITWCEDIDYCIQDSYILFDSSYKVEDGIEFTLSYKGLPVDSEGDIALRNEWERMLVAYVCWKYTRRHFDRYPAYIVNDFKKEFQLQKQAFT